MQSRKVRIWKLLIASWSVTSHPDYWHTNLEIRISGAGTSYSLKWQAKDCMTGVQFLERLLPLFTMSRQVLNATQTSVQFNALRKHMWHRKLSIRKQYLLRLKLIFSKYFLNNVYNYRGVYKKQMQIPVSEFPQNICITEFTHIYLQASLWH